jgi:endo-alpha-1,4-polygalactosaminidase (GH114 family)
MDGVRLQTGLVILCALLFPMPALANTQEPGPAFPGPNGLIRDIQLSEIDLDPVPAVTVIEIDGDDATADGVAALRDAGITAICYINAGAWEDWRADAGQYPDAILGNAYPGWPGERFVDIRDLDVLGPILEARLATCVGKGFDAVDPDNVDTYQTDTGFDLTEDDQIRFNRWLAAEAHARGLAIGQKNVPELADALVGEFDFAVTEDCLVDGWCNEMAPYADAGKPVLMIEYTDRDLTNDEICALAEGTFGSVVIKHRDLDGWSAHC